MPTETSILIALDMAFAALAFFEAGELRGVRMVYCDIASKPNSKSDYLVRLTKTHLLIRHACLSLATDVPERTT